MRRRIATTRQLAREMRADKKLLLRVQDDPVRAMEEFSQSAYMTDRVFYRIVIAGLVVIAITALLFAGFDTSENGPNQVVTAMGTTALGAIAGLLVPREPSDD
ncbi:MAG: hypothetical protein ACFCBV_13495 [Phycisphaerales bacterium]